MAWMKYTDQEEIKSVAERLGMTQNDLLCGYLRQPITYDPGDHQCQVSGTCVLNNGGCYRNVQENEKFTPTECGTYLRIVRGK